MAGPEVEPGTFVYSNVAPHLLSAVLAQAAGISTLAYARRELFDPLRISSQPAFQGPMAQRDNPDVVSTNSFRWLRDRTVLRANRLGHGAMIRQHPSRQSCGPAPSERNPGLRRAELNQRLHN